MRDDYTLELPTINRRIKITRPLSHAWRLQVSSEDAVFDDAGAEFQGRSQREFVDDGFDVYELDICIHGTTSQSRVGVVERQKRGKASPPSSSTLCVS